MAPDTAFWPGKRVLLTGHTGFKGAWLAFWLRRLGAQVTGVALAPTTAPNLFDALGLASDLDHHLCDIRDAQALAAVVRSAQPDIVLHLAAQALVRPSYQDPVGTFATNVMGTAHVLDALRGLPSARVGVMVTTDKVYHNREWAYPYREDDALGGHDPYSASKGACEIVIASYRDAFLAAQGTAIASARAGNVVGGGDWSTDRLIPDAVRAWQQSAPLSIRNPQATRPWQHVLEPLAAYLRLAERLWHEPALAGAYNFGPAPQEAATVEKVIELARSQRPEAVVSYEINSNQPHEARWLALETAKARQTLGLSPRWNLEDTVHRTFDWYQAFAAGRDARQLCTADIEAFENTP